ncbi:MAG: glycan-binding surface protein [Paludibacteraceae bacterium]
MKHKNKISSIFQSLSVALAIVTGFTFQSCNDNPDKYEMTDGVPEVHYVRVPNPASADSLLVQAFMDNTICLVGTNLKSISELWFNDQKALLNSSFITDNTLLVTIPKTIPEIVTNKIYMITKEKDTVTYDFGVQVPEPYVSSISCEYAKDGDVVTLYGDYFINDANVPLTISMAGNIPVTEFISIQKTQVKFKVPAGSQKGYLTVKSIYGVGRSHFQFRDDRGMILDWDVLNANGGWRSGKIKNTEPEGISGNYVYFTGALKDDLSDWAEDNFSFNLWGAANGRPQGDLFATAPAESVLKFEINVTQPWASTAMQIIFTPWATRDTNGYIADGKTPRALWRPWQGLDKGYTTDGWQTVAIPITDFKYLHDGGTAEMAGPGNYGGLTIFVYHGGIAGTACTPYICLDNIRVVPAE